MSSARSSSGSCRSRPTFRSGSRRSSLSPTKTSRRTTAVRGVSSGARAGCRFRLSAKCAKRSARSCAPTGCSTRLSSGHRNYGCAPMLMSMPGDDLGGAPVSSPAALHFLHALAVRGNGEIEVDRLGELGTDLVDLDQLLDRRIHQCIDRLEMIGEHLRCSLTHEADSERVDETRQFIRLRAFDLLD